MAANFGHELQLLALRQWAESMVFAWAWELRHVGTGLFCVEQSMAEALARHLVHLGAAGIVRAQPMLTTVPFALGRGVRGPVYGRAPCPSFASPLDPATDQRL